METALSRLTALWNAGNHRAALKMAAKWPELGLDKEAIQRGWAAIYAPDMYRQMGQNPEALVQAGYDALAARYNLRPMVEAFSECC